MSDDWRELFDRVLDGGELTDAESRALAEALSDEANRREAAELMRFGGALSAELPSDATASRERLLAKAVLAEKRAASRRPALRLWLAAAAAVLLAAAGGAWYFLGSRYPAATVEGDFRVLRGGAEVTSPERGDRVVAGPKGASLRLGGYCELALGPDAELVLAGEPGREAVELVRGELRSHITPKRGEYRVVTPIGSLDVVGTEFTTTVQRDDAGAAPRPGESQPDAKAVAQQFMSALLASDVATLGRLAIEPPAAWAEPGLRELCASVVKAYGDQAGHVTEITETLAEGDFTAVRLGRFAGGADGEPWDIFLVLRRTPAGWRVVDLMDMRASNRLADFLQEVAHPTPMKEAQAVAQAGKLADLKALVDRNPDLVRVANDEGDTLLHQVAGLTGACFLGRRMPGPTPPNIAAERARIAELLLDRGAAVDAANRGGVTPMHEAIMNGNPDVVRVLIAHKADVNRGLQARLGYGPLHLACDFGMANREQKLEMARMLLEAGADPLRESNPGGFMSARPLDVALPHAKEEPDLVALMRKVVAPLIEAKKNEVRLVVKRLLEAVRDGDDEALADVTVRDPEAESWERSATALRKAYAGHTDRLTDVSMLVVRSEWALATLAGPVADPKPERVPTIYLMTCPDGRWRAISCRDERPPDGDEEQAAHHLYERCIPSFGRFRTSVFESAGVRPDRAVAPPEKARFGIYLVEKPEDLREVEETPLDELVLADAPVLTQDDIETYEWPSHTVRLKPGVKVVLPASANWLNKGFVVVAGGRRCYRGEFMKDISSHMPRVPTCEVGSAFNQNVVLPPEIAIGPSPRVEGRANDPRSDERIRVALKALGKLKESAWGEAVEGVQVRLAADQAQWKEGETPTLKAEVRNTGQRELLVAQAQQLAELEVDGKWYRWAGEIGVKSSAFPPGKHYKDIPFTLDEQWLSKDDAKPLKLAPGKHGVRAAITALPAGTVRGAGIRAISNPIEIEILPADPPATGPDRPTAANLAAWVEGKEVIEVCFAGPHMDLKELRKSVSLKVDPNDGSFLMSFGAGGGENRAFVGVCMNATGENVRRLLALQAELDPRGYKLDEKASHLWSYAGDAKAREKAKAILPEVLAAFERGIKETVPGATCALRARRFALGWLDYSVPNTQVRGMVCANPITPYKQWDLPVRSDVMVHLPHLALIIQEYYRPGQLGALEGASPERQAVWEAFLAAVEPLLKLEETPRILDARTGVPMEVPVPGVWGDAVEGVAVRLAAEKPQWTADEVIRVNAEIRNEGVRELLVDALGEYGELELDGQWYEATQHFTADIGPKSIALHPGAASRHITFRFNVWWTTKVGAKPLQVTPGKHTVRVALTCDPAQKGAGTPVRVVSNAVEIDILPAAAVPPRGGEPAFPETITVGGVTIPCRTVEEIRKLGFECEDIPWKDNAAGMISQAINAMVKAPADLEAALDAAAKDLDFTPVEQEAAAHFQQNQKALDLAHLAASMPRCEFPMDRTAQLSAARLPWLGPGRSLARVIVWKAAFDMTRGRPREAIDGCFDAIRLGNALGKDRYLISWLVGVAVDSLAAQTLDRMVATHGFDDARLKDLGGRLAKTRTELPGLTRPLQGERVFLIATVADMTTRRNIAAYFDFMDALAKGPAWEALKPENSLNEYLKKNAATMDTTTKLLVPAFGRSIANNARRLAQYGALEIRVALERFRLAKKSYPKDLAELSPAFLREALVDPFRGGPWGYRLEVGGDFTLWSVGEDLKDDGGIKAADIVFTSKDGRVALAAPEVIPPLTDDEQRRAEALIAQFSDPQFAVRQKAVEDLVKMGPAVLPLVRKTLAETNDNEIRLRCEMVIKGLAGKAEAGPVPKLTERLLMDMGPQPKPRQTYWSSDGKNVVSVVDRDGGMAVVHNGHEGPAYDSVDVVLSPDGSRVAYTAGKGKRKFVVCDGAEGPDYVAVYYPMFSPDSKHVAYEAKPGETSERVIVRDGKETPRQHLGSFRFSPDSRHLLWSAMAPDGWHIVCDGVMGPPHRAVQLERRQSGLRYQVWEANGEVWLAEPELPADGAPVGAKLTEKRVKLVGKQPPGMVTFDASANGEDLCFKDNRNGKVTIVFNGKEMGGYDAADSERFSPDGSRLAFRAKRDGKWFVVLDGKAGETYEEIDGLLVFSPDGAHLAYVARRGNMNFVVRDGKELGEYKLVNRPQCVGNLHFSSDGKHLAYKVIRGDFDVIIVCDEREGPSYAGVDIPCFSPDGKHLYYVASRGRNRSFVVCDGAEGPEHEVVRFLPVSAAGSVEEVRRATLKYLAIDGNSQRTFEIDWPKNLDKLLGAIPVAPRKPITPAAEEPRRAPVAVTVSVASGVVAYDFGGETGKLAAGESRTFGGPAAVAPEGATPKIINERPVFPTP